MYTSNKHIDTLHTYRIIKRGKRASFVFNRVHDKKNNNNVNVSICLLLVYIVHVY
jgi:hypothetical protein